MARACVKRLALCAVGSRTLAIAATLASIAYAPLFGERLPVRIFTTDDGLPRDQLACVGTDARGFIWFCTADGLVRFDGHTAVTFGRDAGLDPARVRSFLHASDGRYWVGTDLGVAEFRNSVENGRSQFMAVVRDDGKPTGGINALAESRDHAVWCGGGRGLFHLSPGRDRARFVEVDLGLSRTNENERAVRALAEDEHGTLWVGAGSGLYMRRPDGRTRRIGVREGLPVDEVRALALGPGGRVWVGTREGLALIDGEAAGRADQPAVRRIYTLGDGLPARNVLTLLRGTGVLWVGTPLGVAEVAIDDADDLEVHKALTGFYAWGIALDLRGDLWIATEAGARRLAQDGFSTYRQEDGLAAALVSSLFETRAGEVCATTLVRRLEISCFNQQRFRPVPIRAARSIDDPGWGWSELTLQDRQGRWWIPTGRGVLQFAAGPLSSLAAATPEVVYDRQRGLPSDNIFRLFEDSRGGLWVATFADAGNGLARIGPDAGVLRVFTVRDGLPEMLPIVHAFAEDPTGTVWVGLEEGRLLRYRGGRFDELVIHRRPGPSAEVLRPTTEELRSLLVDRRGRLWVASTTSGLGRVEDPGAASSEIRWYGTSQGLSSDTVWVLVEDQSGDLFIGTGRGIDRFNPSSGSVIRYAAADGVPRGEIWGGLRDRAGDIWFATTDGVARLTPRRRRPAAAPPTFVTAVRVAGVPLPIAADGATRVQQVRVGPGDRRVEIEFVSPGAREADGLRYQHELEGVDRDWTTTDARTVALAGAAPGSYRFVVRATLANGLTGEPARVEFTVLAPIWRRWWFITLVGASVAGLALAFHRTRVRQLLEVERVRSRIAADLHDGVGASLSRIAILSEVVRRQVEEALPAAVPAIRSIGDNAREVIDDMGDAVWFIDPRLDNLQQIIVRVRTIAAELFNDVPIAWTLQGTGDTSHVALTPEQRRHLYLIVKECLTNISRHACASQVTIRVSATDRLRVEVIDDGVGLEDAGEVGAAHGLANMRARAAAIGGTVTVGDGPAGRGTRVIFDAPIRATA